MPAAKKPEDPTVMSGKDGEVVAGVHPARPIEEASDAASSFEYRDLPNERKPAPSTIAQEQVLSEDQA